jgi:ubiquinone biosynthesis protein UbiJ
MIRCVPDPTPREAQLLDEVARLQKEVELLRQKLDALARRVFGVKSEPSGAR